MTFNESVKFYGTYRPYQQRVLDNLVAFLDNEKIVPYDLKFGNIKYWDASPSDFINLIKNAEYVFTDSFHCMINNH